MCDWIHGNGSKDSNVAKAVIGMDGNNPKSETLMEDPVNP